MKFIQKCSKNSLAPNMCCPLRLRDTINSRSSFAKIVSRFNVPRSNTFEAVLIFTNKLTFFEPDCETHLPLEIYWLGILNLIFRDPGY